MKKIKEFIDAFTIKVPLWGRIALGAVLVGMIVSAIVLPLVLKNEPTEQLKKDENVYLYEEVVFADEIFVKCVGINAEESESGKMTLNLWVSIEQWNTDSKAKTGNNIKLDNDNDFYIVNKDVGKAVTSYFGYTKFNSFKPIDDYSWIGLDISEIGTYEFTMVFEISENWLLDQKLLFLEVDFFGGLIPNALTILLQE